MPVIREYEQRLGVPYRPQGPAADPQVAAMRGRATAELGAAVQKVGAIVVDVAEQRDITRLQTETAQARADLTAKLQQARESGEAADPEFVRYATEAAQEAAAKIAEGMGTRRGAEAARANGANLSAGVQVQALQDNAFAVGEQAKLAAQETQNINRNTLRSNPEQFNEILTETLGTFDGPAYAHIDAGLRGRMKQEVSEGLAVSAVEGLIYNRDPASAIELLDSGELDSLLRAEVKGVLYNKAGHEIREREVRSAEARGRQNLEALMGFQDLADKGMLTRRQVVDAFDKGIFSTAPQALSFWKHNQDRAREIERQRVLDVGISLGDPAALVSYSPKEQQEGFDRYAGKIMQEVGNDDQARVDAVNHIVTRGRELGQMSSRMKSHLTGATVARPAQFVDAAKWYDGLRVVDATYANAHVEPKQAALFNVFLAAKGAGMQDGPAMELVKQAGDPEKLREFQKNLSGDDLRTIEGNLNPWFKFSGPASNTPWARKTVADLAKVRMAFGDASVEDAVEWATEQFKARHAKVGGRWLPIQGTASPDLTPALDEYLIRVPEALKKHGATDDDLAPGGYDLRADRQTQIDSSLQVFEKDTGMPVPGYRVSPQEALRAYQGVKEVRAKEEVAKALSELKEQQAAEDEALEARWGSK